MASSWAGPSSQAQLCSPSLQGTGVLRAATHVRTSSLGSQGFYTCYQRLLLLLPQWGVCNRVLDLALTVTSAASAAGRPHWCST